MQNLVLAVQNTVRLENMGVASSAVAFFRSLGGAIGVQVLGAVLSAHIGTLLATRLVAAGIDPSTVAGDQLDVAALPDGAEQIVREAYGDGMAIIYLVMGMMALIALAAAIAMRNSTLRDTVDMEVKRMVDDVLPAAPDGLDIAAAGRDAAPEVGDTAPEPDDDRRPTD